jgi:hypothetical protein
VLSGTALLWPVLAVPAVFSQQVAQHYVAPNCPPAPCPAPLPPQRPAPAPAPAPGQPQAPEQRPSAEQPFRPDVTQPQQAATEPSLSPERSAATGGEAVAVATPNMIGDAGIVVPPGFDTPAQEAAEHETVPDGDELPPGFFTGNSAALTAALAARISAFKITENESPRPQDRVLFNYNYFRDAQLTGTDVHREMIGFEKTFLDGNASLGMRLPAFQTTGANSGDFNLEGFGDLNIILKYAFLNNCDTGNVLSGGMTLGVPTGRAIHILGESDIHDVLFQPFVGYIYHFNKDLFVQGFSSLGVPTDARDVTILFNDIAVGYWIYRCEDAFLSGIIPVLEGHVNTPLNHRGTDEVPIGFQDSVVITGGSHFVFSDKANLMLGAAVPVTGPLPFRVEGILQFNYRF